jgi:hypothetical protein
VLSLQS